MIWQTSVSILILAAIFFLSFELEGGQMGPGRHVTALLIVVGGASCVTLMAYPVKRVLGTARILKECLRPGRKFDGTVREIVRMARDYRGGWDVRRLEEQLEKMPSGLLRTGVEMIAYRCGREKMERGLREEALSIRSQYEGAGGLLNALSQILPSMGLIGTVIHFIRSIGPARELQDLGACAAAAFLSTFYGLLLGRVGLVCLSNRLKEFILDESFRLDLIQEGILDVRDQEHPREIQFKLESRIAARDVWNAIPQAPEVVLLPPEEMGLKGKRAGSVLLNES